MATSSLKGARVLITGGLGFIGSNLARRVVELGGQVTIVDSLVPEYGGNLFNIQDIESQVRVNVSDIRDGLSLRHLIRGQDVIFNLAAQIGHAASMNDPWTDLDINVRGQLNLLEVCRDINRDARIIFASTRQVYGRPQYLPVDEQHPVCPVDVNGIHKLAAEWYHLLYHRVYGLRTTVLRLTNTFGPRMRVRDARQTFIGVWFRNVVQGVPFEVWGGTQVRDLNYVDDVVEAFCACATVESTVGQVLNLGSSEVISLKQLADLLVETAQAGEVIVRDFPAERQAIEIGDYYANFDRIRSLVGWTPRISLREGIQRTLDFYRWHLDHYL